MTKGAKGCTNCDSPHHWAKGLCVICYNYKRRTGRNRFAEGYQAYQRGNRDGVCQNCEQTTNLVAKGLCDTCYRYLLKYGKHRARKLWSRRENCRICSKPRNAQKESLVRGRCSACRHYLRKHGVERPEKFWGASLGWCDCGHPATHANVPLKYMTVDKEIVKTEYYNLCDDCFALENEPVNTKGQVTWTHWT